MRDNEILILISLCKRVVPQFWKLKRDLIHHSYLYQSTVAALQHLF